MADLFSFEKGLYFSFIFHLSQIFAHCVFCFVDHMFYFVTHMLDFDYVEPDPNCGAETNYKRPVHGWHLLRKRARMIGWVATRTEVDKEGENEAVDMKRAAVLVPLLQKLAAGYYGNVAVWHTDAELCEQIANSD